MSHHTQTQFIIFQTLFHTNHFAVYLMHLSVYLFSSTICLSCSLALHMFTATTPPRWQMSSRANFIGINKKARARWKAMERANGIGGRRESAGEEITITTASAKRGFYSAYTTNCYKYFILALWFIHIQRNDLLPYGIVQGIFFFPSEVWLPLFSLLFSWGLGALFFFWSVDYFLQTFIEKQGSGEFSVMNLEITSFNYSKDTSWWLIILIQILPLDKLLCL